MNLKQYFINNFIPFKILEKGICKILSHFEVNELVHISSRRYRLYLQCKNHQYEKHDKAPCQLNEKQ